MAWPWNVFLTLFIRIGHPYSLGQQAKWFWMFHDLYLKWEETERLQLQVPLSGTYPWQWRPQISSPAEPGHL